MQLLKHDFVTAKERTSTVVKIKRQSPLHLAKIYLAAESEAVQQLAAMNVYITDEMVSNRTSSVLCGWIAQGCTTSIIL